MVYKIKGSKVGRTSGLRFRTKKEALLTISKG